MHGKWTVFCSLASTGSPGRTFGIGNFGDSGIYTAFDSITATIAMQGVVRAADFPSGADVRLSCSMVMNPGSSDIEMSIAHGRVSAVQVAGVT